MVHTKCSFGKRGKPSTEFYINGKPQIYCYGWIDQMNDEPLDECRICPDWVCGEQCEKDFANRVADIRGDNNDD